MYGISSIIFLEVFDWRTGSSEDKYLAYEEQNLGVDCRGLHAEMVKEDPSFYVPSTLVLI